jgi:hypothetical protein
VRTRASKFRISKSVSRLGKDRFDFEPHGFSVSDLGAQGFSALEPVYKPGYILWRAKTIGDLAVASRSEALLALSLRAARRSAGLRARPAVARRHLLAVPAARLGSLRDRDLLQLGHRRG